MRMKREQKASGAFPPSRGNPEIEDKSRLPVELAAEIVRRLDAGMRIEVPGWGNYSLRPLRASRIIDQYYDTPDRLFSTWSKVNGKQLLLRDRHEGIIIGEVSPWSLQTQEEIAALPVEDERHAWLAKVPLENALSSRRIRKAREHETLYTDQDKEALRVQHIARIQHFLGIQLDSALIDIREDVRKVRKTYELFSQSAPYAPQTRVATLALDFIVRAYYQLDSFAVERYAKYEAEKQGRTTMNQFEAYAQALRAVLHIPNLPL